MTDFLFQCVDVNGSERFGRALVACPDRDGEKWREVLLFSLSRDGTATVFFPIPFSMALVFFRASRVFCWTISKCLLFQCLVLSLQIPSQHRTTRQALPLLQ